jgi:hypothetical protein
MLAEPPPATVLGLFLTLDSLDLLLKISKFGLGLFPSGVTLLLLDYHVIQLFGVGSQIISGNSMSGLGSLQRLG